jgi:hypothetical protein
MLRRTIGLMLRWEGAQAGMTTIEWGGGSTSHGGEDGGGARSFLKPVRGAWSAN